MAAPLRWSMVALLCISTIDFGGGRGSFAIFNVVKGLGLPIVLLFRLRAQSGHRRIIPAVVAWVLLMVYAGIAGFWSLFPFSALKLVVQMLGTLVTVIALVRATKGGFLSASTAVWAAAGSLVLAVVATYVTHGWADEPGRFTSFMSAQGFAAFLVGLYCVILCGQGVRGRTRITIAVAIALAIIADGSRIWFIGLLVSSVVALMLSRQRTSVKICATALSIGIVTVTLALPDTLFSALPESALRNRIFAAGKAAYEGDFSSAQLGTLNFRRRIDETAMHEIENSSITEVMFGHGTCNGAAIAGSQFRLYSEFGDPNRAFHNEWMRVFYEWGVAGAVLWLTLIGSLCAYGIKALRLNGGGDGKPLLAYMPGFFIALATENMLAGSVNAVSMGFLFTVALATIPHREFAERVALRHSFKDQFAKGPAYQSVRGRRNRRQDFLCTGDT
ncbi:MAG: O-antigen ligase family protein [Acidobacteriaceae bacterium]|nr:O-antigen ligase family protein [Acidobacteriaceae bacterium]